MEFLKAPTDNLYKFISLAGASLCALMLILAHRHIELTLTIAERLDTELGQYYVDLASAIVKLENTSPPVDIANSPDRRIFEVLGEDEFQRLLSVQVRAKSTLYKADALIEYVPKIICIDILLASIGFAVASWGFRMWYCNTQQYLDKKLRDEVEGNCNDSKSGAVTTPCD